MQSMNYIKMLGVVGTAGLTLAGGARAGSLVQSSTLPARTIPFETIMQFDRFDSSTGTLTDIIIRGTSRVEVGVDVFNSTAGIQGFQIASATFTLTVTEPHGLHTGLDASSVWGRAT
jgi:hypothetical protein